MPPVKKGFHRKGSKGFKPIPAEVEQRVYRFANVYGDRLLAVQRQRATVGFRIEGEKLEMGMQMGLENLKNLRDRLNAQIEEAERYLGQFPPQAVTLTKAQQRRQAHDRR